MEKKDVLAIKKIIDENQKKKIQVETKLETEYKTADTDFGCKTIKGIDKELSIRDKEITEIETEIKEKSTTLDEAYDWAI